MMKLRCLIVEDEPLAQQVMQLYISDCPKLELVKVCKDAFEAFDIIHSEKIHLLFLDINLPKLSGISFIKSLNNPPLVIFTTAYPDYAVEGFDINAVDYLIKPFSFDRFIKAVNKASEIATIKINAVNIEGTRRIDHIFLKSDKKVYRVNFSDISYVESIGDYLKVVLQNKHLIVHDTISGFIEQLPADEFIRIHKSFIVALNRINYIEGNQVRIAESFIPIGRSFKEGLENMLNRKSGI